VVEIGPDSSSHSICQTLLGTDVREQPGGKSPAKEFIEDVNGVVVGVVAPRAQIDHLHGTGGYVVLLDAAAGPFGQDSKASRNVASIFAESKSPATPRMMLLGCT